MVNDLMRKGEVYPWESLRGEVYPWESLREMCTPWYIPTLV